MITEQKRQLDIISVIENAGVQLTARAGRHVGRCPFHDDRSPSFVVYEHHYKCFGCGVFGDIIDFIQMLHGCDFNEACRHLGLKKGTINKSQIIKLNKKRIEREHCQQRERDLAFTLGTLIRWTQQAITTIKTIKDLEEHSDLLHALPFWKHCHHILSQCDPLKRREVVEALTGMETIKRNLLFKPEFDFSKWLKETFEEPKIERKRKTGPA